MWIDAEFPDRINTILTRKREKKNMKEKADVAVLVKFGEMINLFFLTILPELSKSLEEIPDDDDRVRFMYKYYSTFCVNMKMPRMAIEFFDKYLAKSNWQLFWEAACWSWIIANHQEPEEYLFRVNISKVVAAGPQSRPRNFQFFLDIDDVRAILPREMVDLFDDLRLRAVNAAYSERGVEA
jgi:hypothetical protein